MSSGAGRLDMDSAESRATTGALSIPSGAVSVVAPVVAYSLNPLEPGL